MTRTGISLANVTLELPIFAAQEMNFKGRIARLPWSGRTNHVTVIRALDDLSLHIKQGDRLGLCGPNGAGKTTLLRVMAGILHPTAGKVFRSGRIVPMIDQGIGFDSNASGLENIYLRATCLKQNYKQTSRQVDDIVEFSGLSDRIHHPLSSYSTGMRTRLAFAISTSVESDILLLDEGIGTADEEFMRKAETRLKNFYDRFGILVMASHNRNLLSQFCTSFILLENGRVSSRTL